MQYYLKRLVAWIYFLFLRTTLYKLEGYHRKLKEYLFICKVGCENCHKIGCPVRSRKLSKKFIDFDERHKNKKVGE